MKKITRIEVDVIDIFGFAKKKFKKSWDECCDLFEGSTEILPYRGCCEFRLSDLKHEVELLVQKGDENRKLAKEILIAFMEKHKLKKMTYIATNCS